MPDEKRLRPVVEEVSREGELQAEPAQTNQDFPAEIQDKKEEAEEGGVVNENRRMNLKLVVAITVVSAMVAAFVSGGVYVYLSGIESTNSPVTDEKSAPAPTEDPKPTPTPSPSPTPEPVDVSEYKVQVLNGSGVIGAAGDVEEILAEVGFSVLDTGNAARTNFVSTSVRAKSGVSAEVVSALKKTLEEKDYKVELASDSLPASSSYDIVVTVGKN